MHTKLASRVSRIVAALLLAAAAGTGLHACSNSLLRNFTEAGAETVLDDPLPTPTRAAR
jgi:hypothetical protein